MAAPPTPGRLRQRTPSRIIRDSEDAIPQLTFREGVSAELQVIHTDRGPPATCTPVKVAPVIPRLPISTGGPARWDDTPQNTENECTLLKKEITETRAEMAAMRTEFQTAMALMQAQLTRMEGMLADALAARSNTGASPSTPHFPNEAGGTGDRPAPKRKKRSRSRSQGGKSQEQAKTPCNQQSSRGRSPRARSKEGKKPKEAGEKPAKRTYARVVGNPKDTIRLDAWEEQMMPAPEVEEGEATPSAARDPLIQGPPRPPMMHEVTAIEVRRVTNRRKAPASQWRERLKALKVYPKMVWHAGMNRLELLIPTCSMAAVADMLRNMAAEFGPAKPYMRRDGKEEPLDESTIAAIARGRLEAIPFQRSSAARRYLLETVGQADTMITDRKLRKELATLWARTLKEHKLQAEPAFC